ncbi:MAG: hypothetical protein F4Y01_15255 [Gammaproteobacteria bacterium]|nr:hypothetical protein [Gammaproteobacteria bacterium]
MVLERKRRRSDSLDPQATARQQRPGKGKLIVDFVGRVGIDQHPHRPVGRRQPSAQEIGFQLWKPHPRTSHLHEPPGTSVA